MKIHFSLLQIHKNHIDRQPQIFPVFHIPWIYINAILFFFTGGFYLKRDKLASAELLIIHHLNLCINANVNASEPTRPLQNTGNLVGEKILTSITGSFLQCVEHGL